ncbi:DUF4136 domain-containing protein [Geminicoccus roseus]|uniref:DUF4136 domain-containing protein n=1 Tax=Geminicoccus roseus TaxID=404900 RepID=UPI00054FDB80|nr:DUF4136 domain-containing protein [Geminicoccus roseus]
MRRCWQILACVVVLALAGCASEPIIRSDYDRGADFAVYRSFGFAERLGTDPAGYATLTTQRLKRAITQEMESRGYVLAGQEPDLLVEFRSRLEDKVRVISAPPLWGPYPDAYGSYAYGPYWGGMYRPWAGYGGFTDVQAYTEGTLVIDLIDRARREVVWEGVAIDRTQPDADPLPEAAIDATVQKIFADFSFRAGGA